MKKSCVFVMAKVFWLLAILKCVTAVSLRKYLDGQRKYMVYIAPTNDATESKNNNKYCAGIIIHEIYILTTADCLENPFDVYVVTGLSIFNKEQLADNSCARATRRSIAAVFHPQVLTNNETWSSIKLTVARVYPPYNFLEREYPDILCDTKQNAIILNQDENNELPGTSVYLYSWGPATEMSINQPNEDQSVTSVYNDNNSDTVEIQFGEVKITNSMECEMEFKIDNDNPIKDYFICSDVPEDTMGLENTVISPYCQGSQNGFLMGWSRPKMKLLGILIEPDSEISCKSPLLYISAAHIYPFVDCIISNGENVVFNCENHEFKIERSLLDWGETNELNSSIQPTNEEENPMSSRFNRHIKLGSEENQIAFRRMIPPEETTNSSRNQFNNPDSGNLQKRAKIIDNSKLLPLLRNTSFSSFDNENKTSDWKTEINKRPVENMRQIQSVIDHDNGYSLNNNESVRSFDQDNSVILRSRAVIGRQLNENEETDSVTVSYQSTKPTYYIVRPQIKMSIIRTLKPRPRKQYNLQAYQAIYKSTETLKDQTEEPFYTIPYKNPRIREYTIATTRRSHKTPKPTRLGTYTTKKANLTEYTSQEDKTDSKTKKTIEFPKNTETTPVNTKKSKELTETMPRTKHAMSRTKYTMASIKIRTPRTQITQEEFIYTRPTTTRPTSKIATTLKMKTNSIPKTTRRKPKTTKIMREFQIKSAESTYLSSKATRTALKMTRHMLRNNETIEQFTEKIPETTRTTTRATTITMPATTQTTIKTTYTPPETTHKTIDTMPYNTTHETPYSKTTPEEFIYTTPKTAHTTKRLPKTKRTRELSIYTKPTKATMTIPTTPRTTLRTTRTTPEELPEPESIEIAATPEEILDPISEEIITTPKKTTLRTTKRRTFPTSPPTVRTTKQKKKHWKRNKTTIALPKRFTSYRIKTTALQSNPDNKTTNHTRKILITTKLSTTTTTTSTARTTTKRYHKHDEEDQYGNVVADLEEWLLAFHENSITRNHDDQNNAQTHKIESYSDSPFVYPEKRLLRFRQENENVYSKNYKNHNRPTVVITPNNNNYYHYNPTVAHNTRDFYNHIGPKVMSSQYNNDYYNYRPTVIGVRRNINIQAFNPTTEIATVLHTRNNINIQEFSPTADIATGIRSRKNNNNQALYDTADIDIGLRTRENINIQEFSLTTDIDTVFRTRKNINIQEFSSTTADIASDLKARKYIDFQTFNPTTNVNAVLYTRKNINIQAFSPGIEIDTNINTRHNTNKEAFHPRTDIKTVVNARRNVNIQSLNPTKDINTILRTRKSINIQELPLTTVIATRALVKLKH